MHEGAFVGFIEVARRLLEREGRMNARINFYLVGGGDRGDGFVEGLTRF